MSATRKEDEEGLCDLHALKVRNATTKNSRAVIEKTFFHSWPDRKYRKPMQMHKPTYMIRRIQNTPGSQNRATSRSQREWGGEIKK